MRSARTVAWLCLASACGSAGALDPGLGEVVVGARDAGVDAGTAECTPAAGPASPHRTIPPFPAAASDGGVVSSWTLISVTTSGDPLAARLQAFGDALAQSQWMRTVGRPYGIDAPGAGLHVVDAPAIAQTLSPSGVARYLAGVVTGLGPQPDGNLLYVLYGADVGTFGGLAGFHDSFAKYNLPVRGHFAAVARPAFDMYPQTDFDMMTAAASHEVLDGLANFDGRGVQYASAGAPWSSSSWASLQPGPVEIADVCAATRVFEASADGGYYYQRVFDNSVALQCGDDPCVPREPGPAYNVTVAKDWYPARPGQAVAIPFTGWATGAMDNWAVAAVRFNGYPQGCGGSSCPVLELTTALGVGTAAACTPHQVLNDGVSGTLSVTMPAAAASGDYAVIGILSFRENSGPLGCDRGPDTDYYHQWPVGVYVP